MVEERGRRGMLVDANEVSNRDGLNCDICVVGAGAAGITLAKSFLGSDVNVIVLEAGSTKADMDSQKVYSGKNVGLEYYELMFSRMRMLGGSTVHWGGWCRALNEIDFEKREPIPMSGWPFSKAELDAYYEKAHELCELGPYNYDVAFWEKHRGAPRIPLDSTKIITEILQTSSPTDFGLEYRKELEASKNVRIILNANVVQLNTDKDHKKLTGVEVAKYNSGKFTVNAKYTVLAAGGIENPRLLLNSRQKNQQGLGNQYDHVGRYFMEHLVVNNPAEIIFSSPGIIPSLYVSKTSDVSRLGNHTAHKVPAWGTLKLKDSVIRDEKLINMTAWLDHPPLSEKELAIESAGEIYEGIWKYRKIVDDFSEHLNNVINDIDGLVSYAGNKVFSDDEEYNRFGTQRSGVCGMSFIMEQVPNKNSRVYLDEDEKDRFGNSRVILDWQITDVEKDSIKRYMELFGAALGEAGVGRLKLNPSDLELGYGDALLGAHHHIGTTKMHKSEKLGVVDENCELHEVRNLFIAGSSVFPTGGLWNPTLTIVAMSLRLADHLKERLVV